MKLTIEHLKGYLGTGLQLERISYKNERFKELTAYDFLPDGEIDNIKPILHPLSDLTKFREDLGFVPIEELEKFFSNFDFQLGNQHELLLKLKPIGLNHYFISTNVDMINNCLFKWHFDINGLIPQGLAIDINTLTK